MNTRFEGRKKYFTGRPVDKNTIPLTAIAEMENKYFDLVWYARKTPNYDKEYWDKKPAEIREGAFKAMEEVEKKYPREVELLNKKTKYSSPDWEHGFNSGVLAAMRFVQTAFDNSTETCEETGEELCFGGVENAFETFPQLDT